MSAAPAVGPVGGRGRPGAGARGYATGSVTHCTGRVPPRPRSRATPPAHRTHQALRS